MQRTTTNVLSALSRSFHCSAVIRADVAAPAAAAAATPAAAAKPAPARTSTNNNKAPRTSNSLPRRNTTTTKQDDERYILKTYARQPIELVKGSEVSVWDNTGKEYIGHTTKQ